MMDALLTVPYYLFLAGLNIALFYVIYKEL